MASAYDFAVNIVILTDITINKTHNIYNSAEKLFMQLTPMTLL